jgi:hypothetical protein
MPENTYANLLPDHLFELEDMSQRAVLVVYAVYSVPMTVGGTITPQSTANVVLGIRGDYLFRCTEDYFDLVKYLKAHTEKLMERSSYISIVNWQELWIPEPEDNNKGDDNA